MSPHSNFGAAFPVPDGLTPLKIADPNNDVQKQLSLVVYI